ncbi:IucC family-domain-containing protein [Lyophyllum atratum]|nr:IucC family-domain-containing protein [Lyophyllum atratum]
MSSGSGLPPLQHAAFAVISRIISCLVTEQLLRGIYIPIANIPRATGVLVVLSTHLISEKPIISRSLRPSDIFAIVALRHPPVFSDTAAYKHGRPVGLVDPLDMLPEIYELSETVTGYSERDEFRNAVMSCFVPPPWELGCFTTLTEVANPVQLWRKFVDGVVIQDALRVAIEKEIQSSYEYQFSAYRSPPECPTLISTPIEWEQSLVAGHPTHPMHRARMLPLSVSNYDWYHPRIRFVRVARSNIKILGPFEKEIRRLAKMAAERSGQLLPCDSSSVVMPAHELQIPNIVAKFPDVEVYHPDISVQALAQCSIRTVVIPELPGMALKLSVGVKISSALRTISHFTADFGPRFSADIVPKLTINPHVLSIAREPASAVYTSADPELAKHFTAILREEPQPEKGQAVIVAAALLEMDHAGLPSGVSAVEHVFNLRTYEQRATFLNRYIQLACEALLPPLIHNGLAFEAHAQNVLARFDVTTGEPIGFVIRDLGGLRVHPETLRRSTGVDFQFLPGHCVVTETLEEIYPKFYHTFVHNHMQRMIRVLGLHDDGRGWEMLREHMGNSIPENHELRKIWLSSDSKLLPSKCLMRMRMRDSYREMVYSPFPNMIQYRPEQTT